jgi:signal transduction histidine kinase
MNELLKHVMPTVNMAIHDALVYNTLLDYQNNLERKVKERTRELMKARNRLTQTVRLMKKAQNSRDRFFANISHEFRTPLTLILGPVNAMLAQTRNMKKRRELTLVQQNARRLNLMINQLLDLSRLQAGHMTLQAKPENMVALLKHIEKLFESHARLKRVELRFYSDQEFVEVYLDRHKIEHIFYNLLSNALKFTPAGGNIEIRVDLQQSAEPVVREKKTGSSLKADTVASHFLVDGDTTHIDSTIIDGSQPVITGPSGTGRMTTACPWQRGSISAGWKQGSL